MVTRKGSNLQELPNCPVPHWIDHIFVQVDTTMTTRHKNPKTKKQKAGNLKEQVAPVATLVQWWRSWLSWGLLVSTSKGSKSQIKNLRVQPLKICKDMQRVLKTHWRPLTDPKGHRSEWAPSILRLSLTGTTGTSLSTSGSSGVILYTSMGEIEVPSSTGTSAHGFSDSHSSRMQVMQKTNKTKWIYNTTSWYSKFGKWFPYFFISIAGHLFRGHFLRSSNQMAGGTLLEPCPKDL